MRTRFPMVLLGCLLAFSLSASCGGASQLEARETLVQPPPDSAARPWTFVARAAASPPLSVVPDGDAWVGAAGRVRFRVDAALAVGIAAEPLESPAVGIARDPEGWVFLTRRGEVFRADDPLGPLQPIGRLGDLAVGEVVSSRVRLAVLDEEATLFVVDGSGPHRVASPGPVADAVFVTNTFGVRLDLSGRLYRTNDGGASWTEQDLDAPSAPYEVIPGRDGVVLASLDDGRSAVIASDGTVSIATDPPGAPTHALPSDVAEAIEHEVLVPRALVSAVTAGGRALVRVDAHHVRLLAGGPELQMPDGPSTILAWGEHFLVGTEEEVFVTDGSTPLAPFTTSSLAQFDNARERWIEPSACVASPAAADDEAADEEGEGEEGGDEEAEDAYAYDDAEERPVEVLCVRALGPDGHEVTPREIALGAPSRIRAVGGGRVIVSLPPYQGDDDAPWRVVDLETGLETPLALPERGDDVHVSIAADGTVAISLRTYEPSSKVFRVGPIDGALAQLNTVPEEVVEITPLDARHLVAVHYQDAWLSEDAGASFTAFDRPSLTESYVSFGGGGPGFRIFEYGERGFLPPLSGSRSAFLGDWIWVAPDVSGLDALLAPVAIDGAPAWRGLMGGGYYREAHVACEPLHFLAGHPTSPTAPRVSSERFVVAGGWAQFDGDAEQAFRSGPYTVHAGGVGDDGSDAWTARGRAPDAPAHPADGWSETTEALGVTSAMVVLLRCAASESAPSERVCDVLVLPRDGGPFAITSAQAPLPIESRYVASLPGVDGSLALHFSSVRSGVDADQSPGRDLVIVLPPTGAAEMHAFHTGALPALRSLARDAGGHLGLLVERGEHVWFAGVDGSVGPTRPAYDGHLTGPCRAHAPDAISFVASPWPHPFTADDGEGLNAHGLVSIGADGGACVEAFWTASAPRREQSRLRGAVRVHAEEGAFVGAMIGTDGSRMPMTCRTAAQRPGRRVRPSPDRAPLLARLADGTWAAAVSTDGRHWDAMRLSGAAWTLDGTLVWRSSADDDSFAQSIVAGSDRVELLVAGREGAALVTSDGETAIEPTTAALSGPGTSRTVVTRRGSGASTVLEVTAAGGSPAATPALFSRGVDSVWSATGPTGMALVASVEPAGYALRVVSTDRRPPVATASFSASEARLRRGPPAVVGGSTVAPLALAGRLDASHRPSLIAYALDARRARPLGPAVERSVGDVVPLAIASEPTRIVYADETTLDPDRMDVRVAELRGTAWYDVAPPWPTHGMALAAVFDGADVVVMGVDRRRHVLSARLHEGVWAPLDAPVLPSTEE